MQPVVYDVAVSLDGYISGPNGDISKFPQTGPIVDDYYCRLKTYAVAIMGRSTYEFGYGFGLEPGQNPYQNMQTFVFSKTLRCPAKSDITVEDAPFDEVLPDLKATSRGPLYLCGGGRFAGSVLAAGLIDILRLKRIPIILGDGVRLFGASTASPELTCVESRNYGAGQVFQEFRTATARAESTS